MIRWIRHNIFGTRYVALHIPRAPGDWIEVQIRKMFWTTHGEPRVWDRTGIYNIIHDGPRFSLKIRAGGVVSNSNGYDSDVRWTYHVPAMFDAITVALKNRRTHTEALKANEAKYPKQFPVSDA